MLEFHDFSAILNHRKHANRIRGHGSGWRKGTVPTIQPLDLDYGNVAKSGMIKMNIKRGSGSTAFAARAASAQNAAENQGFHFPFFVSAIFASRM